MSTDRETAALDLSRTTAASHDLARAWMDLGLAHGWTPEQTKRRAIECIAAGITPDELGKALDAKLDQLRPVFGGGHR